MPIPTDEAAEIARRYGLGLPDAESLSLLADDRAHAERLAHQFGAPTQAGTMDSLAHKASSSGRSAPRPTATAVYRPR